MYAEWAAVAAVLTTLATGLLYLAIVPTIGRRRVMVRRVAVYLGSGTATAAGLPHPHAGPWEGAANYSASALLRGLPQDARAVPLIGVLLVGGGAWLLTRQGALALAAALQALVIANLWGHDMVATRRHRLDIQTLPTLLRLSSRLRAGATVLQGMEAIANEGPSPTREEFHRVVDEIAVGVSLDDALDHLAQRIGTADYQALSIMLAVQRSVGGNLAVVLDRLAETVRERVELRLEVSTLTAQQRFSSWILVLLPLVVLAFFSIMDPGYVRPLFTTELGSWLLLLAATLQAVGSWAIHWAGELRL